MNKRYRSVNRLACLMLIIFLLIMAGCSQPSAKTPEPSSATKAPAANNVKKMPDQLTKVKLGTVSPNIDSFPWRLAQSKGIFKKYNLDVELVSMESGSIALRGLQSGDLEFAFGLSETFITGVSQGANVKIIGALVAASLHSIYVTPDIKKPEDLKGKVAGSLSPGNPTDLLMRWWLKKRGLEPDKDVRMVSAGSTGARLEALKTNNVQVALMAPPTDIMADAAGLRRLAYMRDDLKDYNHEVIVSSDKLLNAKPEIGRALMAATAEAIGFIKDNNNRKEVTEIGMQTLKLSETEFTKSLDFALPAFPDKGKVNVEGIKFSIDLIKQLDKLEKDVKVTDIVDEQYYAR